MAREARLWEWMRKEAEREQLGLTLDMRRVENLLYRGTPDVDLCWASGCAWIELKGCDRPARETTYLGIPMRLEQVLWLKRRWQCGGSCWVYVRVGYGPGVLRYLVRGRDAGALEGRLLTEAGLRSLSVLPPGHKFIDFLARVTIPSRE